MGTRWRAGTPPSVTGVTVLPDSGRGGRRAGDGRLHVVRGTAGGLPRNIARNSDATERAYESFHLNGAFTMFFALDLAQAGAGLFVGLALAILAYPVRAH
jgi:hypothetical protein